VTEPNASPLIQKFFDVWKDCFAAVFGQLGVVSPVSTLAAPISAPSLPQEELDRTIWGRFSGGDSLKGELMLLVEKPVALQFAQLLMSEPLDATVEFTDMHRDAFAELLRQVAGQAATAWKQETGAGTQINFQAAPTNPFVPAQSDELRLSGEKVPELSLRLLFDADLCTALSTSPEPEAPSDTEDATSSVSTMLPPNLDLLLDVELEATIRFGEREMLLRDIFGLMPGAVVELNQLVNEPAELLVAGRRIARGEVVVVDGNFGLRVTDVASTNQRAELIQA
jgi:flagellar motor switch protein FliN/FliY